jgi:hypothetical protein
MYGNKANGQSANKPKLTSKMYELAKKQLASAVSLHKKGKSLNLSDEQRQRRSDNVTGPKNAMYGKTGTFKDKHHSEESKQKMRKPKSAQGQENIRKAIQQLDRSGSGNSMYGKKGSDNPNSRALIIHGEKFVSIKEAKEKLNKQYQYIVKNCEFI